MRNRVILAAGSLVIATLTAGCSAGSSGISQPAAAKMSHTTVTIYNPWSTDGRLSPRFEVVGHLVDGYCPTASIADPSNQNAWRCYPKSEPFFDPCFAPPGAADISELACAIAPYLDHQVLLLKVSHPLAKASTGIKPRREQPLLLILSNGAQCTISPTQGTQTNRGYDYVCNLGPKSAHYASTPDTAAEPWTVRYAVNGTSAPVTIAVTAAWV